MISATIKNTFLNFEQTQTRHRRTVSVPASQCFYDNAIEEKSQSPMSVSTCSGSLSSACSFVQSEVSTPVHRSRAGTTVMIKNIPCKYTQEYIMEEVSAVSPDFDFLYMPPARRDGGSKGYAFVNFCDEETAAKFLEEFQGHHFYRQPNSLKRAEVGYAEVQGLAKNMKFYKRCKAIKSKFQPYVNKAAIAALKK